MQAKLKQNVPIPTLIFLLVLTLLGAEAIWTLTRATPAGIGLTNDSIAYIAGARGILSGQGYSDIWLATRLEPITHYPPMFSLVLAGVGLTGLDPLRGARLVNVLLFGLNTILMGLTGWKMTRSRVAGLVLAGLFSFNNALLYVHAFALSEPLFLCFSLLSFLAFTFYIERSSARCLAASGVAVGLAYLTRYSGLALVATILVALVFLESGWRKRIKAGLIFMASAVPWMAAWMLRNRLLAGTATNRNLDWHPVILDRLDLAVYNFSQFLLPVETWRRGLMKTNAIGWIMILLGLGIFVWLLVVAWRSYFKPQTISRPEPLAFLNGLYIFGYLAAIAFSLSLFDASTKFHQRILLPVYISLLALSVAAGTWLWRRQGRLLQVSVIIISLFFLGTSAVGRYNTVAGLSEGGQGYASWKWRDSQVMATLQMLPVDKIIYTNSPPAVYAVLGRPSRTIPTPTDPVDQQPRSSYQRNLAQMRGDILAGRAVLALFNISDIEDAASMGDIRALTAELNVIEKTGDAVLYGQP